MDRDIVARWVVNLAAIFSIILFAVVVILLSSRGADASGTSVALSVILLVILPFCGMAGIASMRGRGRPLVNVVLFGASVVVFVSITVLMIVDLARDSCTAGSFVVCDGNDAVNFGTTVFFDAFVIGLMLVVMVSAHRQMVLDTSATQRVRTSLHFDESEGVVVDGEPV